MDYITVKEASKKFNISERRIQKLCETNRIKGCDRISGIWLIPQTATKPADERLSYIPLNDGIISLSELCKILSISTATGRNWIKLGKIKPELSEKNSPYFNKAYVEKLKQEISQGTDGILKSRRNKKFVSGNFLYKSYVSESCKNLGLVQSLLKIIEQQEISLDDNVIQLFVADCALHLFYKEDKSNYSENSSLLKLFLNGTLVLKEYDSLIEDFVMDRNSAIQFLDKFPELFSFNYFYEKNEDILGLIYISCKNLGNRKATGSYYTPTKIVKKLIANLNINSESRIFDPCCGTGNFLLQLPEEKSIENIYGNDIDSISVKIARLNMALKYPEADVKTICEHITISNYLTEYNSSDFSHIIGNPPWGFAFSDNDKKKLKNLYKSAQNTNIESFDVFIEKSINSLHKNGNLAFILPESVLNVKSHSEIRSYILKFCDIKKITYLGNVFDGVQCPCIILCLNKTDKTLSTMNMQIENAKENFVIKTERNVVSECFNFNMTDDEYNVLKKIRSNTNTTTLAGNADFALGIVTGNNKKFVSTTKTDKNEIVLKGSDICQYHVRKADNFIEFEPEFFQQVAPVELYRAKEKLLYRFISNQFVFAYDSNQTLSLNSCNILIPHIQNLNIKYIMAILNSSVAQFIYKKEFNSIKVLRSHIESIPIPLIDFQMQEKIIEKANVLIDNSNLQNFENIYNEIDAMVFNLFHLTELEVSIINNVVGSDRKFLN